MTRNAVSGLVLMLLFTSMFTSVFIIQPVKAADGTIYIRVDGSVDPPTAPILNVGNVYYTFTANIYDSIVVERDNIVVDGAGYTVQGTGSGNGIDLLDRRNVTVKNADIKAFVHGIKLSDSKDNVIRDNTLSNNFEGIRLQGSFNTISSNRVTNNSNTGVKLGGATHNTIFDNTITHNGLSGIDLGSSSYNTLSGNVMAGNGYNFGVRGNSVSAFLNYVDTSNMVDDKPIYYWVNEQDKTVPQDAGCVIIVQSTNITVGDLILTGNLAGVLLAYAQNSKVQNISSENNHYYGIELYGSSNNKLIGNTAVDNAIGIFLHSSSWNVLSGNIVRNNSDEGIGLHSSSGNTILDNAIVENGFGGISPIYYKGIFLYESSDNRIYHNNFIRNTEQVHVTAGYTNVWDDGYPSGGNYWSDYTGSDSDGDGIGDTPYIIDVDNRDRHPLITPWTPASPWAPASPWPMFQHDAQHTGRSPYIGPNSGEPDARILVPEGYSKFGPVAIDADGTIYSRATTSRGRGLYAFNPDGTEKWFLMHPTDPIIAPDSTIYASYRGGIAAVNLDGTLKWKKGVVVHYTSQHHVFGDGVLYFIAGVVLPDGSIGAPSLVALDTNSEVKWIYDIRGDQIWFTEPGYNMSLGGGAGTASTRQVTSPSIGYDGTIYFGSLNVLYAFDPNGTKKWQRTFEVAAIVSNIPFAPVISPETIYVTVNRISYDPIHSRSRGGLYALSPSGSIRWNTTVTEAFWSPPVAGPDGSLYAFTYYYGTDRPIFSLIAVSSVGEYKWARRDVGGSGFPIVDAEGNVFVAMQGRSLVVGFSPIGEVLWQTYLSLLSPGEYLSSTYLALNRDGTLLVPGRNKLYAISDLGPTPPPKFSIGDRVRTTANLNVREGPGLGYEINDTMLDGALGQIMGGPMEADGYVWWDVHYDVGIRGWSAQNWLELTSPTPPNQPPSPPTTLSQYTLDNVSIPVEGMVGEEQVKFVGVVDDPDSDQVGLQVELRRIDEYNGQFDETKGGLKESSLVDSGSLATIEVNDLIRGRYHWRARAIDEHGAFSEWFDFGNNDIKEPDFIVCNKFKIAYPEGWMNLQLFVPLGYSPPGYLDKFKFDLQNRRDMWYKIAVYRRLPDASYWEDITDQIWQIPYIGPYSATAPSLLYSPIDGEEIKIELKNDQQDLVLQACQVVDIVTRYLLGVCLPPQLVLAFADWTRVKAELSEFSQEVIVPLLSDLTFSGLQKFLKEFCEAALKYRRALSSILIDDFGLRDTAKAARIMNIMRGVVSGLFKLIDLVQFAILSKDLLSNMIFPPQEESVILSVERRLTSTVAPNLILTEGLRVIQEEPYYQGDKINTRFAIKNTGLLPVSLHALTVGGRTEEGYVQDFSFRTGITINPDEIYSYEGELSLLHEGQSCFFVALQLEDGEWITNVPTEAGIVNTLYVDVEPVSIARGGYLCSPGELCFYDNQGRVTGLVAGETRCEIPHSFYYQNTVVVFYPENDIKHRVVGTEEGTYDLEIIQVDHEETTLFTATKIPTSPGVVHEYSIDWSALSQDEEGVTVEVDSDGNGEPEYTFTSDSELTQNEYVIGTDIAPPQTGLNIGEPKYVVNGIPCLTSVTPIEFIAEDNLGGSDVASTAYRIYNATYDSGWKTYTASFYLVGLDDGVYQIAYNSTDIAGNVEPSNTVTIVLDNTGPSVAIENPPAGWALQDGVTFIISTVDASGTTSMNVSIREADGGEGTPVGFEDLPAVYDAVTGKWTLFFDTLQLPDGYYIVIVNAEDHLGHTSSTTVAYSIRNWAVLELLPASENNKAGRTMPIKFALRVAAAVDPLQPFVYNEDLTIDIYATDEPDEILQASTFGDDARDYRINGLTEVYITNFKTLRTPEEYRVDVYRNDMLIDSFTFGTVK